MNIPVLATPMGKGVIPDTSPLVVAAARSTVLGQEIITQYVSLKWLSHELNWAFDDING
jgi:hypothetical protein